MEATFREMEGAMIRMGFRERLQGRLAKIHFLTQVMIIKVFLDNNSLSYVLVL